MNDLIATYIELETDIQHLMTSMCTDACALCTACCCRADICEEVGQSAFLSLLLKEQNRSNDQMDDRFGWLDNNGCSLEYGRPPICYAYFCDQLLMRFPDEDARYVAKVLGQLLTFIGENALDDWHLTEITQASDLEKVNVDSVMERIEEAQSVFEVIDNYVKSGRLTQSDHDTLAIIELKDDL